MSCSGVNRTTPECDCDEGYFENDSGVCEICHNKCVSCTDDSSCTVCKAGRDTNNDCACLIYHYEHDSNGTC